jgi:hypothetical protein
VSVQCSAAQPSAAQRSPAGPVKWPTCLASVAAAGIALASLLGDITPAPLRPPTHPCAHALDFHLQAVPAAAASREHLNRLDGQPEERARGSGRCAVSSSSSGAESSSGSGGVPARVVATMCSSRGLGACMASWITEI